MFAKRIMIALAMSLGATSGIAKETPITCTNPASGAQWQIKIDYARGTVDAHAATISATQISWRDTTDGSNYVLDRKSGNLTMVAASSTGGYFLHHRCKLPG